MGMTINEAIKDLKETKQYLNILVVLHHPANKGMEEAMNIAIATLRKYQKIRDIINNTEYIQEDVIRYKMICEVMKNGSN